MVVAFKNLLVFWVVLVAATVGSLLPAALVTSSIVWTERLLALLIVLALLVLPRNLGAS